MIQNPRDDAGIGLASTGRSVEQLKEADLVVTSLCELTPQDFANALRHASRER